MGFHDNYDTNTDFIKPNIVLIIQLRTMNVYLPGNAETVIDYDCVSSYTRKMVAQIVDMENSVIVPSYSFKAGTFVFQNVLSSSHWHRISLFLIEFNRKKTINIYLKNTAAVIIIF